MRKVEIDEILHPEDGDEKGREQRVQAKFWTTVRKAANRVPFMEDVVAGYYCAMDPKTPTKVRAILFAALAYFVLPLDSVPDFIAGFGFTDDIAVLLAAFQAIQGNLKERHQIAAREALKDEPVDG